jgi:hypothetical protein
MRPLGRPRFRLKDNIKIDLKETEREDVNCIHEAQDREWFVRGGQ